MIISSVKPKKIAVVLLLAYFTMVTNKTNEDTIKINEHMFFFLIDIFLSLISWFCNVFMFTPLITKT